MEYVESSGGPLEILTEAVMQIYAGDGSVEARKLYFHFREFLEERILLSNAAPKYDPKATTVVPGHGTYPGSFESGKKK